MGCVGADSPEAEEVTDLAIGGRAGDVGNVDSRGRHIVGILGLEERWFGFELVWYYSLGGLRNRKGKQGVLCKGNLPAPGT